MPTIQSESKFEEPKAPPTKKKKGARPILILIIIVVLVVIIGFFATRFFGGSALSLGGGGDYQAVFLINGQVYFGHIVKETKDVVVLRDIYYLRANAPLQQTAQGTANQSQSELSLVKLGNELHGPRDEMRLVRNNILFIEDLKDDSKVTVAIEDYIKEQQED